MLFRSEKEVEEGRISIRKQGEGDQGSMSIGEFVAYFNAQL